MFCNQCQETVISEQNKGCTMTGVCGKMGTTADLQDLLIHTLRGVSFFQVIKRERNDPSKDANEIMMEALFATITNANFDKNRILEFIHRALDIRDRLKRELEAIGIIFKDLPNHASWTYTTEKEALIKAYYVGHLSIENEDLRSLSTLLLFGIKGMAAYAEHAYTLEKEDESIFEFMNRGLLAYRDPDATMETLLGLVMECGEFGVKTMALLDGANTEKYGVPSPHKVNIGVRKNTGILISGHDLLDLEELLEQTKGTGVDVYTHGEMLPANYYPFFEKYDHLVGNYGGAWWNQIKDFNTFNGPALLTTNCLVPPLPSYKDRVYTTNTVGFEGVKHIPDREMGKAKGFSAIIEHAKKCDPPTEIETGQIVGGFNYRTLLDVKDKVLKAVQEGKIKKFFVMAGCDGRHKSREYYSDFARSLPPEAVILTAGCAKYRYNKLIKDDIDGIPRVLDAGQCNDSYSLAVFALKLAEELGIDVNDLPIEYNIAWYEQKAVLVLLALLHLGVKNIHLGPTLPAFVSSNVLNVLVEKFQIGANSSVEDDLVKMMA